MAKEIIKGGDKLWNLRYDKVEQEHPEFRGKAAVYSYATRITNPKTISFMAGYSVREIPTDDEGDVDVAALRAVLGPHTAGIMLTNPSTLGVFERRHG